MAFRWCAAKDVWRAEGKISRLLRFPRSLARWVLAAPRPLHSESLEQAMDLEVLRAIFEHINERMFL